MKAPYESSSFVAWLESALNEPVGRKQALTLASLTKKLGYRSPRLVSMVLKGQRQASPDFVRTCAKSFRLNARETAYLELLARRDRARARGGDTHALDVELSSMALQILPKTALPLEVLRSLSSWAFYPVEQLCFENEPIDPERIAKALRNKISPEKVMEILAGLAGAGLLERVPRGYVKRKGQHFRPAGDDVPSAVIARVHVEYMQRAVEALVEGAFQKRAFRALTLRMDPARLNEARADITAFIETFDAKYSQETSRDVFQCNLQLFALTGEESSPK